MTEATVVTWGEKEASILALESNGRVDPLELIEAARDPSHPCHRDFTWDVEQASAERWRDQARAVIRKCKFEVLVDETITERVVRYVESPLPGDSVFVSLKKMKSTTKLSAVMASEVARLCGNASRVYGIAVSKNGIVGVDIVRQLGDIRDQLATMKAELSE